MTKIALVTGAGTGIGRACALALFAAGYSVVLAGRRLAPLEETLRLSGADASRALVHGADVSDPAQVRALFDATVAKFGRLDLVFNNAGSGAPAVPLEELSPEDWLRAVGANLSGPFYCIQNAFRVMKAQTPRGGRVVNNGSISASAPRPNSAPYTATKHGVSGLTKAASLDGRKYDIAVGQIDIGNALTEMTTRMTQGIQQADGSVRVEPTMDVADVARTLLYMDSLPLSANALFVTVMATKMPFVGRG